MARLEGRCLCGKITYSCDAEPVATAVCHCTHCQKQTGTAFSIIVGVPRDALQIEGDSLATFTTVGTDTGKDTARQFCRECGSPIASIGEALPQLAFIKAGTLDDTSWLEPQMHVWSDSAQPWVPLDGHAGPKLPRGPQLQDA
jgi:hypothetical protein